MKAKGKTAAALSLLNGAKGSGAENRQNSDKNVPVIFGRAPSGVETIEEIPLDVIDEFPGHPFRVIEDDSMERLKADIKAHGMHTPIQVRRHPSKAGRYIILAGHRRVFACRALGSKNIKAIIMDVTEEEAVRVMVTSNLDTRDVILPSEKAFAYKMLRDAESGGGSTTKTADEIGAETGESADTVNRYIRLTYLIPRLLDAVDNNVFGYAAGSDISFLPDDLQADVSYYISNGYKLDGKKAKVLKDSAKSGNLTTKVVEKIMVGAKNAVKSPSFSLKSEKIKGLIPKSVKRSQQEDYIARSIRCRQLVDRLIEDRPEEEVEQILTRAVLQYKDTSRN